LSNLGGHDQIADFTRSDIIDLRGTGITGLADMEIYTADDGAELHYAGSSIFLDGFTDDIVETNFWFDVA
jgi:hypothetical protein